MMRSLYGEDMCMYMIDFTSINLSKKDEELSIQILTEPDVESQKQSLSKYRDALRFAQSREQVNYFITCLFHEIPMSFSRSNWQTAIQYFLINSLDNPIFNEANISHPLGCLVAQNKISF